MNDDFMIKMRKAWQGAACEAPKPQTRDAMHRLLAECPDMESLANFLKEEPLTRY